MGCMQCDNGSESTWRGMANIATNQNQHCTYWQTMQEAKINIACNGKKNPTRQNCNGKKRDLQEYFLEIAICINMIHKSWHRMQCSTHQCAKVDIALVDVNFFPLPISISCIAHIS